MKIVRTLLLAVAAVLLVPTIASADRREVGERAEWGEPGERRVMKHKRKKQLKKMKKHRMKSARRLERFDRMVERHDQDGDGVISPDEAGPKLRKLRRFDHNGDGWVDREEVAAGKRGKRVPAER